MYVIINKYKFDIFIENLIKPEKKTETETESYSFTLETRVGLQIYRSTQIYMNLNIYVYLVNEESSNGYILTFWHAYVLYFSRKLLLIEVIIRKRV